MKMQLFTNFVPLSLSENILNYRFIKKSLMVETQIRFQHITKQLLYKTRISSSLNKGVGNKFYKLKKVIKKKLTLPILVNKIFTTIEIFDPTLFLDKTNFFFTALFAF